jgi:chemotaxis regulatin CheY-phosphate phosphatase CheZ
MATTTIKPQATPATLPAKAEILVAFYRDAVAALRQTHTETLPSVNLTLNAIIQATEVAAQRVLDNCEALAERQRAAASALASLVPLLPDARARAACAAVAQAGAGVDEAVSNLISAMEFQDLTAQHLRATIDTVTALREKVGNLLLVANVDITGPAAPVRLAKELGAPATPAFWRQEIADNLIAEKKSSQAMEPKR